MLYSIHSAHTILIRIVQLVSTVEQKPGAPDLLRIPAIIYLVGTLAIIGISYVLPRSLSIYVIITLAVWGVGMPLYMYIYLRSRR